MLPSEVSHYLTEMAMICLPKLVLDYDRSAILLACYDIDTEFSHRVFLLHINELVDTKNIAEQL